MRQRPAGEQIADVRAAFVLLAAGSGTRAGGQTNKVFLPLAGRRVFTWSLYWTADLSEITRSLLVVKHDEQDLAARALARESPRRVVEVVTGGATRHESERNALRVLAPAIARGELDIVVIHDAARPLVGPHLFREVIAAAHRVGGAVPGRLHASLRPMPGRDSVMADGVAVVVQTPQAFRAVDLLRAYESADAEDFSGSDTSSCVERFSELDVAWVPGPVDNIKITFPEDLLVAQRLLERAGWDLTRDNRGVR